MRIDPPPVDADPETLRDYVIKLHNCVEGGRDENRASFRRLKLDGSINIVAMAGILITLATAGIAVIRWTDRADARLDLIPQLVDDGRTRDSRLNKIDAELSALQSIAEDNRHTLRAHRASK